MTSERPRPEPEGRAGGHGDAATGRSQLGRIGAGARRRRYGMIYTPPGPRHPIVLDYQSRRVAAASRGASAYM